MSDPSEGPDDPAEAATLVRLHQRFGWWVLALFLLQGLVLESLHAVKADFYLSVASETRRLMWTLAHAHGSLLGLMNLGLASTLRDLDSWSAAPRQLASRALLAATVLIPGGFFLGGLVVDRKSVV